MAAFDPDQNRSELLRIYASLTMRRKIPEKTDHLVRAFLIKNEWVISEVDITVSGDDQAATENVNYKATEKYLKWVKKQ